MAKITEIRELVEFEQELDEIAEYFRKRHEETKRQAKTTLTSEDRKEIADMIEKAHRRIRE